MVQFFVLGSDTMALLHWVIPTLVTPLLLCLMKHSILTTTSAQCIKSPLKQTILISFKTPVLAQKALTDGIPMHGKRPANECQKYQWKEGRKTMDNMSNGRDLI